MQKPRPCCADISDGENKKRQPFCIAQAIPAWDALGAGFVSARANPWIDFSSGNFVR
jgi:hypothetical protein